MPVTQTLTAWRNATWAPTLNYIYSGAALPPIDHIAMQLRLYAGAADPALLAENPIAFTDTDNGDGTRTLSLSPSLTPAQLATLPGLNSPEAGDPQTFAFDIRITYADAVSEILSSGTFNVLPGVTTI